MSLTGKLYLFSAVGWAFIAGGALYRHEWWLVPIALVLVACYSYLTAKTA
jgi:hypothetical protein